MFPETLINSQAKTKDHQFDGRCKTGCEYCSDDAFYVDDLLHRWLESTLSFVGDPTEEVLGDNEIELFVDKVMEISPEVDDRTRIHVNGIQVFVKCVFTTTFSGPDSDTEVKQFYHYWIIYLSICIVLAKGFWNKIILPTNFINLDETLKAD